MHTFHNNRFSYYTCTRQTYTNDPNYSYISTIRKLLIEYSSSLEINHFQELTVQTLRYVSCLHFLHHTVQHVWDQGQVSMSMFQYQVRNCECYLGKKRKYIEYSHRSLFPSKLYHTAVRIKQLFLNKLCFFSACPIVLVEQISRTRCDKENNFGCFNTTHMWTDDNCGGIFEMGSTLYKCNSEQRGLRRGFTVCDGKKTKYFVS